MICGRPKIYQQNDSVLVRFQQAYCVHDAVQIQNMEFFHARHNVNFKI